MSDFDLLRQLQDLQATLDADIQENEAFLARFGVGTSENPTRELRTRPETRVEAA